VSPFLVSRSRSLIVIVLELVLDFMPLGCEPSTSECKIQQVSAYGVSMIVARHEVPGGNEENSPVPAGRLNGSRLSLDANIPFKRDTERF
jgi:hypothetical protein